MDKKWLEFLREQYPVGSRVRLREMKDPYHPVEPGTMGTLSEIDDIGTFHINWDNGRALGLVIGEDSFTILPPEATPLKLYMPLTADLYERNDYGNLEDESTLLNGRDLLGFEDQIMAALVKNRSPEESERGVMHWYHEKDGVESKVRSAVFTAEIRDGQLWGVAECRVVGTLTQKELEALKEYISGQASDGWGEGLEQREIRTAEQGELYVHLWNSYGGWSIQTEQERFAPVLADGLPELCFSVHPSTGDLICIQRGGRGYYPSDWSTDDRAHNQELADYNNERLGVTKAQRLAMECGSMIGWDSPGADPAQYENELRELSEEAMSQQIGGM